MSRLCVTRSLAGGGREERNKVYEKTPALKIKRRIGEICVLTAGHIGNNSVVLITHFLNALVREI